MARPDEALKEKRELEQETLLMSIDELLETPMVVLSFVMLGLFIVELTVPISAGWRRAVYLAEWFIWVSFAVEFVVKLAIAPRKAAFLRSNWLMAAAVLLPALRIFRAARAARAARSLGALRVIAVGNRSVRQLRYLLGRTHLQYVLALLVVITVLGAAGVYFLERSVEGATIRTLGDALWWSAGTVTTVGTELYPISPEARILAVIEMVFGMSVFGYTAGALASTLIHVDQRRDEEDRTAATAGTGECSPQLLEEIQELQRRIEQLAELSSPRRSDPPSA